MRRPDEASDLPSSARAGLTLRRMTPADIDPVMVIERRAFKHPWSTELFLRELQHDWSTILLAERGAKILGFVIFWIVHDEIHVLNVATDPSQRRQGVARALLDECIRLGKERGAKLATLEVRRSNLAAIKLYESLGFRHVGIRANYYADEGEDAIVMLMDV